MRRTIMNSESIFGMSKSKKDMEAELDELAMPLMLHLIKLYIMPDSKDVNHWRQEVYNFLHSITTFKHSKKLPSEDFIYDNVYTFNAKWLHTYVHCVEDDYYENNEIVDYDFEGLKIAISSYIEWLSRQLSITKIVSRRQVYAKLEELGFGN